METRGENGSVGENVEERNRKAVANRWLSSGLGHWRRRRSSAGGVDMEDVSACSDDSERGVDELHGTAADYFYLEHPELQSTSSARAPGWLHSGYRRARSPSLVGPTTRSQRHERGGGVRHGRSDMREEEADADADADVDEFDVASATCAMRRSLDAASAT